MPGGEKGLEKRLVDLLEAKKKHGLDDDKFLLMLGMVNLMGVINLLDERSAGGVRGSSARKSSTQSEMIPFMGMFGGPKNRQQNEGS